MTTLVKLIFSLMILLQLSLSLEASELAEFFNDYDEDQDQAITEYEIIRKLKQDDIDNKMEIEDEYYEEVVSPLFQFYDTNRDGQLNMEEFQYFANDIVEDVETGQSTQQEENEKQESEELGESINEQQL